MDATGICRIARVSSFVLGEARHAQKERDYLINKAMKQLYDAGCRRIVAAKLLPPTGDGERYLVRGFI